MSRAQQALIEDLQTKLGESREYASQMRGELQGVLRGEARATEHLADRLTQLVTEAADRKRVTDRAVGDVRTLLRLIASHVLDVRAGVNAEAGIEILVDELHVHGLNIGPALQQVSAQRADGQAKVSAAEAAAAIAEPVAFGH